MRNTVVGIICPFCRKEHRVKVNEDAYYRWQEGELIQNAMLTSPLLNVSS